MLQMKNIILISMAIIISGCTLLQKKTNPCFSNQKQFDETINFYEQNGHLPTGDKQKTYINNIGEIYAIRSSFEACHKPYYEYTRTCFGWGKHFPEGIVHLIGTPFIAVFETFMLPVDYYKTWNITQNDINKALYYMRKARKHGYTSKKLYLGSMGPPPTTLDELGFKIKNNKGNCNQSVEVTDKSLRDFQ